MVPNHIWDPEFFGPQEVWSPKDIGLKEFGHNMKIITWLFHDGPKLLGDQIYWGPEKSGAQMRLITISVIANIGRYYTSRRTGRSQ